MSRPEVPLAQRPAWSASRSLCPPWCVTGHRADLGEEDWLHSSEPVSFVGDLPARLVMSIDPGTGEVDGPYVFIGAREYSLAEATALAQSLLSLVSANDALADSA
ncbi:MAG: hypothetical protein AVDCRST_MAG61-222 [uncultured Friedmanniella sp.]|uniref:Uncharacterized protein n=1 Tax=uncultured Friedmanniella sp. TaxID=335381 RepID=A0A6J4K005_9ACTN|nr:hypothetical protein [uncultured Friedmanniella sp.]CAA9291997.1 MAG: hypothetical protein AVDCRST_MAG61-222 [uncultured Friedmanniella sp.]